MKTLITFLIFPLLLSTIHGQNLLVDGSLEGHNTSGCDYNNVDSDFNGHYTNLTSFSFGGSGEIDILDNCSSYGGPAVDGTTRLGIAHNGQNNVRDRFSFDISGMIITGNEYSISFYMEPLNAFGRTEGEIQIGISAVNNDFGTVVFSGETPLSGGFVQVTGTFVAPVNASYLTVQPNETNDDADQCWIMVDAFELIDLGSSQPECDVVSADIDTIILPLNDSDIDAYTFAAEDWIKMTGEISSGSGADTFVEVRAGDFIELNPSFESKLGTNALFNISPCDASNLAQPNQQVVHKKLESKRSSLADERSPCEEMVPPYCSEETKLGFR